MFVFLCMLVVLAFIVVVLVFGDSPGSRNTPLHKLHRGLIWCRSKVFYYTIENPTIYAALRWTVPIFYCLIIITCLVLFFTHVYDKLDIRHSLGHSVYIFFSIALIVLTTELITFSDPGYSTVDTVNAALEAYAENGLIFFPNKTCVTCRLPKPARSKHCSVCNRCVYLLDHHCIFVNNCMGQNNYRWFIAFLVANVNFMIYGGYLCWTLMKQGPEDLGWWRTITRTSEANKIAGILLILASVFSPVVSAFILLHFRYMYLGVTTNEADKWSEIEHLVSLEALFQVVDLGIYVERATRKSENAGDYEVVYILLDDQRILFLEDQIHEHTLKKVLLVEKDLTNIYDRGFLPNVNDRLFPQKR